ncbi:hypothetical protein G7Y89_g15190 [Cudoniella acicularis]|uniref:Uncharacterized protein n=1 Tax=Cudoniella acicularis TaxID=354080 RepID=A0A8H4QST5_9HELO|nr:hypothetical protein G7Y89_g15190 [Cudoniella acicularis]
MSQVDKSSRGNTRYETSPPSYAGGSTMPLVDTSSKIASRPPRSIFTSPKDIEMASRQLKIQSLSGNKRRDQEKWAQTIIQKAGICPQGFAWKTTGLFSGGYICEGKKHTITHSLLAEGLGGVFLYPDPEYAPDEAFGPYYKDPHDDSVFVYSGPVNMREYAPPTFTAETSDSGPTPSSYASSQREKGYGSRKPSSSGPRAPY